MSGLADELEAPEECQFCGWNGCTLECTEILTFEDGQQFVASLPYAGDMRTGYKLRTDGTPSANPIIFSYHKSYFTTSPQGGRE